MKIPGADFLENASSGVFWGFAVPVFVVLESLLNVMLLLMFPFPLNIALVLVIPGVLLLLFLRLSLERFINWWNAEVDTSFEWNIEKTMPEYLEMLETKNEKEE